MKMVKTPKSTAKDNQDEKSLGAWIGTQKKNYNNCKNIMKNSLIREQWEQFINNPKYSKYFLTNEEEWEIKLNQLIEFIDENGKIPSSIAKDNQDEKSLGAWIGDQKKNYNNCKYIMKNSSIREQWEQFVNNPKYSKYFLTNEEEWEIKLNQLIEFIDENGKTPSSIAKDNKDEKSLGAWIGTQKKNYNNCKKIMKNSSIREQWEQFINNPKYSKYFLTNEEEWEIKLNQLIEFIYENGKTPNKNAKDNQDEKSLGAWLSNQKNNYKNCKYIMKTISIREKWEQFVNNPKYSKYFDKSILSEINSTVSTTENSLEDISDNDNDSSITISTKKKKNKVKKLSVLDSGVTSDESESELNKKSLKKNSQT